MLMNTVKSEICPVPLQNHVHLLKHTAPNILFIYQICGEKVRKMTLLPSSSTSSYSLIFVQTHCCLLIVVSADPHMSRE